jgi:trimeric autotransporter adhesin
MKLQSVAFSSLVFVCSVVGFIGCSSGTSSSSSSSQTGATIAPTVTSVAPSNVIIGSGAFTLSVNGNGFQNTTTLQVGSVAVPAAFVSSNQLTATVPASLVTTAGTLLVVAANGSLSSRASVSLEIDNSAPVITGFAPSSLVAGSGAQPLSVTGTGFLPTTLIQVGGKARTTTYVSATQVSVALTADDTASAGHWR